MNDTSNARSESVLQGVRSERVAGADIAIREIERLCRTLADLAGDAGNRPTEAALHSIATVVGALDPFAVIGVNEARARGEQP